MILPFFFIAVHTFSQTYNIAPLTIGDKVPDGFLENIQNYDAENFKYSDFKGKLVILDFWNTYCSTCISFFPKLEKLQAQNEGNLKIILVNSLEDRKAIKDRLFQINKKRASYGEKLLQLSSLTAIYRDSTLAALFPHKSIPHHVWISDGKVLAITDASYATFENVQQVLAGKKVKFYHKDDFLNISYSMQKNGILKPVLPSFNPTFYSGFMAYRPLSNGASGIVKDSVNGTSRMYRPNNSIYSLFIEAFTVPSERIRTIFEVKDWGPFEMSGINEFSEVWFKKNLFSYELCVPENDETNMRKYMQQDLNRFFGGVYGMEGKIEKRIIKSIVLIQTKAGVQKSTGVKKKYERIDSVRNFINYPFRGIVQLLAESLEDMSLPLAFIDESGFTGQVDIQLIGKMSDLPEVRKQLLKYGLDIIETVREMEVLVIRNIKK